MGLHRDRSWQDGKLDVLLLVFVVLDLSALLLSHQQVQEDQLMSLVDWLTAQPRAAQLLDKDSSIVNTLEYYLNRYLKDVKRHLVRADKR